MANNLECKYLAYWMVFFVSISCLLILIVFVMYLYMS